jgi:hypothetical protein
MVLVLGYTLDIGTGTGYRYVGTIILNLNESLGK